MDTLLVLGNRWRKRVAHPELLSVLLSLHLSHVLSSSDFDAAGSS